MDYHNLAEAFRERSREISNTKQRTDDAAYKVYSDAVQAAGATRDATRAEASNQYNKVSNEARETLNAANVAAVAKAAMEEEAVLAELIGGNTDGTTKLLAWMVTSQWFRRFPDHCITILESMPNSLTGLTTLSQERGWCGDFDTFLREALVANVLPDVPVTEKVEYNLTSVMNAAGLGARSQEPIKALFDQLIKLIPSEVAKDVTDEAQPEKANA